MSCWVVPSLAAELWRMPLEQVLRLMRDGSVIEIGTPAVMLLVNDLLEVAMVSAFDAVVVRLSISVWNLSRSKMFTGAVICWTPSVFTCVSTNFCTFFSYSL